MCAVGIRNRLLDATPAVTAALENICLRLCVFELLGTIDDRRTDGQTDGQNQQCGLY